MRVVCASLLAVACGHPNVETSGLSGGSVTTPGTSTTGSTGTTATGEITSGDAATTTATTTSTSAADGPRMDMGIPDLPQGSACNGKVDVLFVVGQSGVIEHLDARQGSYADFAAIMTETFADYDLHVMVVDSDGLWGDEVRCPKDKCPSDGACLDYGGESDFPCWALHDPGALTDCDNTLGAGVVFPAGWGASNMPCELPDGRRFLKGDDPDFAEKFVCAAKVGATPGDAMVGWAMGEALSFDLQAGCNAGFLRDDALLLAVMLVGFEDSPYSPYAWAERVLDAKGREQDKIVAMAVANDWKTVPEPLCDGLGDEPVRSYKWLQYFDHGVFGSNCAPSFAPFFHEAAELVTELCEPGTPK